MTYDDSLFASIKLKGAHLRFQKSLAFEETLIQVPALPKELLKLFAILLARLFSSLRLGKTRPSPQRSSHFLYMAQAS